MLCYINFRILLCENYYLSDYFRWSDPSSHWCQTPMWYGNNQESNLRNTQRLEKQENNFWGEKCWIHRDLTKDQPYEEPDAGKPQVRILWGAHDRKGVRLLDLWRILPINCLLLCNVLHDYGIPYNFIMNIAFFSIKIDSHQSSVNSLSKT